MPWKKLESWYFQLDDDSEIKYKYILKLILKWNGSDVSIKIHISQRR